MGHSYTSRVVWTVHSRSYDRTWNITVPGKPVSPSFEAVEKMKPKSE